MINLPQPTNPILITGTGTGVGKTFITTKLATQYREKGFSVGVLKPVETGCNEINGELLPSDALLLSEAAGNFQKLRDVVLYRYKTPVAPSVAEQLEDQTIDLQKIISHIFKLSKEFDVLLVEGAGGLLVPIKDNYTFADLARETSMDVIPVIGSMLGAINITALTFEALKNRSLNVLGYIINDLPLLENSKILLSTNRTEIRKIASTFKFNEIEVTNVL